MEQALFVRWLRRRWRRFRAAEALQHVEAGRAHPNLFRPVLLITVTTIVTTLMAATALLVRGRQGRGSKPPPRHRALQIRGHPPRCRVCFRPCVFNKFSHFWQKPNARGGNEEAAADRSSYRYIVVCVFLSARVRHNTPHTISRMDRAHT